MYFNFEDYRPDTPTLPRSLTRLEAVLLTIVVYLSIVILMLVWPHLPFVKAWEAERQQALAKAAGGATAAPARERAVRVRGAERRYAGAQAAQRAGAVGHRSQGADDERAPKPTNSMPFARGNTPERMEGGAADARAARAPNRRSREAEGRASKRHDAAGFAERGPAAGRPIRRRRSRADRRPASSPMRSATCRSTRRSDSYVNLQGGADQEFAKSIQFDTQGCRVRSVAAPVHRADPPQLDHPDGRDVQNGHVVGHVLRRQGRADHRAEGV